MPPGRITPQMVAARTVDAGDDHDDRHDDRETAVFRRAAVSGNVLERMARPAAIRPYRIVVVRSVDTDRNVPPQMVANGRSRRNGYLAHRFVMSRRGISDTVARHRPAPDGRAAGNGFRNHTSVPVVLPAFAAYHAFGPRRIRENPGTHPRTDTGQNAVLRLLAGLVSRSLSPRPPGRRKQTDGYVLPRQADPNIDLRRMFHDGLQNVPRRPYPCVAQKT